VYILFLFCATLTNLKHFKRCEVSCSELYIFAGFDSPVVRTTDGFAVMWLWWADSTEVCRHLQSLSTVVLESSLGRACLRGILSTRWLKVHCTNHT